MSQRLLHKRLFLWAVARILIPPGSLPPIVGDCGKPAALLGSADVQVGDSLAIYIHDPCAYLGIGRFVRLPSGLCIVVINLDRNTNKAVRHWCDLTGVRIPIKWWRWRESNPRPKRSPREYLRVQFVYNISFVPGRQTGRHIGSFMSSWPPAKLKAAHVQYLIDALALFGTTTGRTAAYN